ncbi:MAG: hypothetical protein IKQ73_07455 [Oscillospiraceae bacterium]|nr:hypothetical protein [Oscillospiraceae bacterium]
MSYELDEARLHRGELSRDGGYHRQLECLSDLQSLTAQITHMVMGFGRVEDVAETIAYGLIAIGQLQAWYNCEEIVDSRRRQIVYERLARLARMKEADPDA